MRRILLLLSVLVVGDQLMSCFGFGLISGAFRSIFCCLSRAHGQTRRPTRKIGAAELKVHAARRSVLTDLLSNGLLVYRNYEKACSLAYDQEMRDCLAECCQASFMHVENKLLLSLSTELFVCTWAEFKRQQCLGKMDFISLIRSFDTEWAYYEWLLTGLLLDRFPANKRSFLPVISPDLVAWVVDQIIEHEEVFFRDLRLKNV